MKRRVHTVLWWFLGAVVIWCSVGWMGAYIDGQPTSDYVALLALALGIANTLRITTPSTARRKP